jgi:hypothetical protein
MQQVIFYGNAYNYYIVAPFLYNADDKYTSFLDLSTTYRLSWFVEADEIQFKIQAAVTGW